ncbi:MAG: hypothetical protein NTV06_03155, partial [candidate division Zixibacteria bacterium]|nr:hypothetical protein [candidate division Zixibacteria bacterium]
GYPFFTGQTSLPYTEIIGFHWPLPLDHKGYMKHKLCDSVYLKDMIARKIPRLMVTVYDSPDYLYDALNAGYEKAFQSDVVSIYKRK